MSIINSLFKKKYRDSKRLAKRISTLINQPGFIEDIIENGEYLEDYIPKIMRYYIYSNDTKCKYSFSEFEAKLDSIEYHKIMNSFDYDKYNKDIILAHSCNGYNFESIRKNGLKNHEFDNELSEEIKYVEAKLGKSIYSKNQGETKEDAFYFTLPGRLVTEYSMKASPERIFLGILQQDPLEIEPYIIGEGKDNYYKRVIRKRIKLYGLENDTKLLNCCDDIIDKFCSKDPLIVFFTPDDKNNFKVWSTSINNGEPESLDKYIDKSNIFADNNCDICYGGFLSHDYEDLVTTTTNISKSNMGIIKVPDYFKSLELIAKKKGFKEGEKIDIYTLEESKLSMKNMKKVDYGGTGDMYLLENFINNEYLYKPAQNKYSKKKEKYRGIVQECAYKVQCIVDSKSSIFCKYVETNDLCGSLQDRIQIKESAPNYYSIQAGIEYHFSKDEIDQFMREFVTDYLLCNFDSHGNNFIVDDDGLIRGIDKEQSFKFINRDNISFFDINCNPNADYGEQESIYNFLFKKYVNNEIEIDFNNIKTYINRVNSFSNEEYEKNFIPYCVSISQEFGVDKNQLLKKIVDRKKNLEYEMSKFVDYLNTMRNQNKNNEMIHNESTRKMNEIKEYLISSTYSDNEGTKKTL